MGCSFSQGNHGSSPCHSMSWRFPTVTFRSPLWCRQGWNQSVINPFGKSPICDLWPREFTGILFHPTVTVLTIGIKLTVSISFHPVNWDKKKRAHLPWQLTWNFNWRWPWQRVPTWLSCSQNKKWIPGQHWGPGQPSPSHHHFWLDAYICEAPVR